jgi:hypothetical protein
MSQEPRPRSIWPVLEPYTAPVDRALETARQAAHYWELDEATTDALLQFTVTSYHAREIFRDFDGTTTQKVSYQVSPDEDEMPQFITVTRETFRKD